MKRPNYLLKRAYIAPAPADGTRILVERLWPRGLSKARAQLDLWLKDIAPSGELRRWFSHDPAKWPEFQKRYRAELKANAAAVAALRKEAAQKGTLTLVFAARDEKRNSAVVLKSVLEQSA
jgi:uncharacterized protein YeaO (DUF488 family)